MLEDDVGAAARRRLSCSDSVELSEGRRGWLLQQHVSTRPEHQLGQFGMGTWWRGDGDKVRLGLVKHLLGGGVRALRAEPRREALRPVIDQVHRCDQVSVGVELVGLTMPGADRTAADHSRTESPLSHVHALHWGPESGFASEANPGETLKASFSQNLLTNVEAGSRRAKGPALMRGALGVRSHAVRRQITC